MACYSSASFPHIGSFYSVLARRICCFGFIRLGFVSVLLLIGICLGDLWGNIVKANKQTHHQQKPHTPNPETSQFGFWAAVLRQFWCHRGISYYDQ